MSNGCELVVLMPLYIAGSFLHFDSGSEYINIYLLAFPNFAKVLTEPVVSLLQGFNDVWIQKRSGQGRGGGIAIYELAVCAAVKGNGFQAVCSGTEYITERLGLE